MITPPSKRRVLHFGDKGLDVLAYQRALTKTIEAVGLIAQNRRTGLYGQGTLADTLRLQARLKLEKDGKVGQLTWTAIDPQLDAYGRFLLRLKTPPPTPPGQRVAHQMRVLIALAPRHYTQARPYPNTLDKWKMKGGDCSGTAELAYLLAGAADPNGTAFNGYGNTYSQIVRGVRVPEASAAPGDLTFYGTNGPTHVVVELGGGMVGSHGSEGGPYLLPRHYRADDYIETRRYL